MWIDGFSRAFSDDFSRSDNMPDAISGGMEAFPVESFFRRGRSLGSRMLYLILAEGR